LHDSIEKGFVAVTTILLEKGADVHVVNMYGWTALHFAAVKGNIEVTELLLKHGSDKNTQNMVITQEYHLTDANILPPSLPLSFFTPVHPPSVRLHCSRPRQTRRQHRCTHSPQQWGQ
jgi:hypothetical protein